MLIGEIVKVKYKALFFSSRQPVMQDICLKQRISTKTAFSHSLLFDISDY